jgi:hypothetical protein
LHHAETAGKSGFSGLAISMIFGYTSDITKSALIWLCNFMVKDAHEPVIIIIIIIIHE